MNDETIVGLFWNRDESALAEAQEQYGAYLLYIARNLLRDEHDAEECLNDALLAAWDSIPPNRPENLKTYLGMLARDAAINVLRRRNAKKRKAESVGSLEELTELASACTVESALGERELARLISAYVRSLGEPERGVFVRRYWYYDSIESICDMYGFGKSKVKMMLKRTRDGLAAFLKEEGNYEF
ncbi:MAG: sigma-70 family RNA polymerase sigma factor [Clostridia bacterium]|nr:sigma-70 family RNA polymerase sigma factor [Clostridia bacterium]